MILVALAPCRLTIGPAGAGGPAARPETGPASDRAWRSLSELAAVPLGCCEWANLNRGCFECVLAERVLHSPGSVGGELIAGCRSDWQALALPLALTCSSACARRVEKSAAVVNWKSRKWTARASDGAAAKSGADRAPHARLILPTGARSDCARPDHGAELVIALAALCKEPAAPLPAAAATTITPRPSEPRAG